jgi:hypothetical protein
MSATALEAQAASALDVLVHVRRDRSGQRRVEQLALWPAESLSVEPRLIWTRSAGTGPAAGPLRALIEAADVEVPALLAQPSRCQP